MIRYSGTSKSPSNPFAVDTSANGQSHQEIVHEAVVTDVIVNDSHPEYGADGYNVGAVQYRALKSDYYKDKEKLNWALPMESNVTDYPLLNEIILIHVALNRMYYSRKVNTSSRVTSHALFGLNEELSEQVGQKERNTDLRNSKVNPRVEKETPTSLLGKYFKEKPGVYRLRSDEGDIIYEGRSGQSIRFGAAWKKGTIFQSTKVDQSPNLLFRVGPDSTQKPPANLFGLVQEDINKDQSSIWMVSDQIVPLTYATKQSSVHGASIVDFPQRLDGNQIVINTDRFVINTKTDKLLGFSAKGIHWTSAMDYSVDADRNHISSVKGDSTHKIGKVFDATAGTRFSIVAPKVYVGLHTGDDQPIPCGAELASFLEKFLNIFINNASSNILITGTPGKPSPLSPIIVAALRQLKNDVGKGAKASFNSSVAFTIK